MAERKQTDNDDSDERKAIDSFLSTPHSSSTLEIVMDDQSVSNSATEDSNSCHRTTNGATNNRERLSYRKRKQYNSRTRENHASGSKSPINTNYSNTKKDPKSHRLIEKRRRDRMNACLSELLELTPHEVPETQRRIEKTEIIEMAIRHMRYLISNSPSKDKNQEQNSIENYRLGYRNGLADFCQYLDANCDQDKLLNNLSEYVKQKESDLAKITVLPNPKRPSICSSRSDKKSRLLSTLKGQKGDENLSVISEVEQCKKNDHLPSLQDKQDLSEQVEPNIKVPIFVLHPSGTHYIPMSIDSSIVSHAFKKNPSSSRSTSSSSPTSEQVQCHPVSIPVNFNPISTLSDPYELEIQNINVIGTRHQTSVRPN